LHRRVQRFAKQFAKQFIEQVVKRQGVRVRRGGSKMLEGPGRSQVWVLWEALQ